MDAAALKVAKKILKKEEDGTKMKIKALAKIILKKIDGDTTFNVTQLKEWLTLSSKFEVDGKKVFLKVENSSKKRKKNNGGDDVSLKKVAKLVEKAEKKEVNSVSNLYNWRKEHKIVLKDAEDGEKGIEASKAINESEEYLPYTTFCSPKIKAEINELFLKQCTEVYGFTEPSAIQAQCWPVLLHAGIDNKRRDVVGIAETGSGKTLAFALPALTALAKESHKLPSSKRRTPRMLVLAPTRELAMQSHAVIEEYGSLVSLTSLVVYGGVPKQTQKYSLRKGVDCVVATPGRIKDLINEGACNLSKVSQLVLDEADRMLDMGFEEDVRFIISACKDKEEGRQTAMFSATWPAVVMDIALEYMVNPVRVYVGFEAIVGSNGENSIDDSLSANKRVVQNIEVLEDRAREGRLQQLLTKNCKKNSDGNRNRILIFALYKREAARLETNLSRNGWEGLVTSIHGDKAQEARTRALANFKKGTCPLLVATDVAARGLDIPNVEMVINYTFPLTIEDYVHRIGRTGRAGKTGISHTFFQPSDKSHAGELQQVIKQVGQSVPEELMKFGSTIKKKEHKLYGNFGPRGGMPMKKAVKITFDSESE